MKKTLIGFSALPATSNPETPNLAMDLGNLSGNTNGEVTIRLGYSNSQSWVEKKVNLRKDHVTYVLMPDVMQVTYVTFDYVERHEFYRCVEGKMRPFGAHITNSLEYFFMDFESSKSTFKYKSAIVDGGGIRTTYEFAQTNGIRLMKNIGTVQISLVYYDAAREPKVWSFMLEDGKISMRIPSTEKSQSEVHTAA